MSRREVLARADAALGDVERVLSHAANAERVDRLMESAAVGSGYTDHAADGISNAARVWASEGCISFDCGCSDLPAVDELPLSCDFDQASADLPLLRRIYSYEAVERVAQERVGYTQLEFNVGGTDPPAHPGRVKERSDNGDGSDVSSPETSLGSEQ